MQNDCLLIAQEISRLLPEVQKKSDTDTCP